MAAGSDDKNGAMLIAVPAISEAKKTGVIIEPLNSLKQSSDYKMIPDRQQQ